MNLNNWNGLFVSVWPPLTEVSDGKCGETAACRAALATRTDAEMVNSPKFCDGIFFVLLFLPQSENKQRCSKCTVVSCNSPVAAEQLRGRLASAGPPCFSRVPWHPWPQLTAVRAGKQHRGAEVMTLTFCCCDSRVKLALRWQNVVYFSLETNTRILKFSITCASVVTSTPPCTWTALSQDFLNSSSQISFCIGWHITFIWTLPVKVIFLWTLFVMMALRLYPSRNLSEWKFHICMF